MTQQSKESLRKLLQEELGRKLGIPASSISDKLRFKELGVDSQMATGITVHLEKILGRSLPPTLFWDAPTLAELSAFLAGETLVQELEPLEGQGKGGALAIVGMGCRFPGGSDSLEKYWQLLLDGVDAVAEISAERLDLSAYFDPSQSRKGTTNSRFAGMLAQVDGFDADFFAISPKEAEQMDPQQRLMLELAWEALEDAGVVPDSLRDSKTGVYMGAMWDDYARLQGAGPENYVQHTVTGQDISIVAARISYQLGLMGPCMTVNTACSSSLVALHLACRSLREGESNLAIVGAVNLILAPHSIVAMGQFGGLCEDGRAKAFDARANGYVRAEGGGLVVLKRLSEARAAGDRIYAIVRGSALNNDGFSNGLTAPNPKAQEQVIRLACRDANLEPGEVSYVEAHGTGTQLGDPIEAGALGAALGVGRAADKRLRVGSVKTQIGHLEAAAGMAGLIKASLALHQRVLPANLHFQTPSPRIDFERLGLQVQAQLEPWPDAPLLAGVSSFGFGGTNAHVLLEGVSNGRGQLLCLAAETPEAFTQSAAAWTQRFEQLQAGRYGLADLLWSMAPASGAYRAAAVIENQAQALAQFAQWAKEAPIERLQTAVVWVFSGHGSYWRGAGLELWSQEPRFRESFLRIDGEIQRQAQWSPKKFLLEGFDLDRQDYYQPMLFAIQVALAGSMRAWGFEPQAVIGHSAGEVSAAHVAGILNLEDACRLILARSLLLQKVLGKGAMMLLPLSEAETEALLAAEIGDSNRASISCINAPASTVVCGDPGALQQLRERLEERSLEVVAMRVNVPSHSVQVEPYLEELGQAIASLSPSAGHVPMYATVSGQKQAGLSFDRDYWLRNIRRQVRFADGIDSLLADGYQCFFELSPHPLLVRSMSAQFELRQSKAFAFGSLRREEDERSGLLAAVARFYELGIEGQRAAYFPAAAQQLQLPGWPKAASPEQKQGENQLFTLTARSEMALRHRAAELADWLAQRPGTRLADLGETLNTRRQHDAFRIGLVAATSDELREKLLAYASDASNKSKGLAIGKKHPSRAMRIALVFPGQGSQWLGMGQKLAARETVFASALHACERAFQPYVNWSLAEALGKQALLERDEVIQPAIFAVQVALVALWRSWGLEAEAVVGHSMGEVAAAHVAGILNLEDAARIICQRSKLAAEEAAGGAMAVVASSFESIQSRIAAYPSRLSIAAENDGETLLLSGDAEALDALCGQLEAEGQFVRRIAVRYASHSPFMDPILPLLKARIEGIQPVAGRIPFMSTVRAGYLEGTELDAAYWLSNLRDRVRFREAIQALADDGFNTFLEVSPHPVLGVSLERIAAKLEPKPLYLGSIRRDENERDNLLESAAILFVNGQSFNWSKLQSEPGRLHSLPNYPWQRERFWLPKVPSIATQEETQAPSYGLLGTELETPLAIRQFQSRVRSQKNALWNEHRVQGVAILPAMAFLEIARSAAALIYGKNATICDFVVEQPLLLEADHELKLFSSATPTANTYLLEIQAETSEGWRLHARAQLRAESGIAPSTKPSTGATNVETGALYQSLSQIGLDYGPRFQGLRACQTLDHQAWTRVELQADAATDSTKGWPVQLLDACLQAYFACFKAEEQALWLPLGLESAWLCERPPQVVRVHVQRRTTTQPCFDFSFQSEAGEPLGWLIGLEARQADRDWLLRLKRNAVSQKIFEVQWKNLELQRGLKGCTGSWLVFADRGGWAAQLAERLEQRGAHCRLIAAESFAACSDQEALCDGLATYFEHADKLEGLIYASALDLEEDAIFAKQPAESELLLGWLPLAIAKQLSEAALKPGFRSLLLTRGACAQGDEFGPLQALQAQLWGFGNSLAREMDGLQLCLFDLDPDLVRDGSSDEFEAVCKCLSQEELPENLLWRDGAYLTPQLEGWREKAKPALAKGFRLYPEKRGQFDSARAQVRSQIAPGPDQVAIEIVASGVNFRDLMNVLGTYPGEPGAPGLEAAGRVIQVGTAVKDTKVGDRVVAVGTGLMADGATLLAAHTAPLPEQMSFAEGAAWPIAFLTASYGLLTLGQLKRGERILIHAAAGGVGLAAIQLAQRVGAEVYATVSTQRKRAHLERLGVKQIFDSRDPNFAQAVRIACGERGLDLVLNSLSGAFIPRSLELLAKGGRFIEMGKSGIWSEEQVHELRSDVRYHFFDLIEWMNANPEQTRQKLLELSRDFESGELQLPVYRVLPFERASELFRAMARGKQIGKLVLQVREEAKAFAPDALVVISGGAGALGLKAAAWLADRGVCKLALISRHPTAEAESACAALKKRGVDARFIALDLADASEVARAFRELRTWGKPVGLVHAAGLLQDGVLALSDWETYRQPLTPKIAGALHLLREFKQRELAFVIHFSSVASLLGSTGQASYAAANAFLNTHAARLRQSGVHASAVLWGPWSGIGLAAADSERGIEHWRPWGIGAIDAEQGILALDRLFENEGNAAVFTCLAPSARGTNARAHALMAALGTQPVASSQSAGPGWLERIRACEPGKRANLVAELTRACFANVMGIPAQREIDPERGFRELGMDSLMTVALRNRLQAETGLNLPTTLAFNYPNLKSLSAYLNERIREIEPQQTSVPASESASTPLSKAAEAFAEDLDAGDLDQLSAEDLTDLLQRELDDLLL